MKIRTILRAVLVGISYYSFKKIIEKFPTPYRHIIVFALRLGVFLALLLTLFSFLSGRISSISNSITFPSMIRDILLGVCFILSIIVSFLLTAVCEEVYKKISELERNATKKIDNVKETVSGSFEKVKESIAVSKESIKETCKGVNEASRNIYDSSAKVTRIGVDTAVKGVASILKKIFKKK